MDNLFLALQNSKTFKRRITLLKTLIEANQSIHTSALASQLECSSPTVLKEVAKLNQLLKNFITITTPVFGELKLDFDKPTHLDTLTAEMAKETTVYKIIHSIFHHEQLTLAQALIKLDVSRTTFLRTVWHMNDVLATFGVSISTTILEFIGREEDIRYCFFSFYSDLGGSTIISASSHEDAEALLSVSHKLGYTPLHHSHFRIAIWISIVKVRWRHKQFVQDTAHLENMVADKETLFLLEKMYQQLYRKYHVSGKLGKDEILWSFVISLHAVSYSKVSDREDFSANFAYRRAEFPEVLTEVRQFLAGVFPADVVQSEALDTLEGFLVNLRLLSQVTSNFQQVAPKLKELIQQAHGTIARKWYEHLLSHNQFFQFKHLEDIAVSLTIFHMTLEKKTLKIICSFAGQSGFDNYLVQISKRYIPEDSQVDYYLERAVTKKAILAAEADVVIANYDLGFSELKDCVIIRLANIPTLRDWQSAHETILGLLK